MLSLNNSQHIFTWDRPSQVCTIPLCYIRCEKNHYFLSQGWIGATYFFFFVWTDEMCIIDIYIYRYIYIYIYLIWQLYGKFFCVAVIISNSWKEKRGQSFNFSKFIISILISFLFFLKRHFFLRDISWSIHWR